MTRHMSWCTTPKRGIYLIEPIAREMQHMARRNSAMTTTLMLCAFLGIAYIRARNQPRQ